MLSSRDYRIIGTSLAYFLVNYDEVERLHAFNSLPILKDHRLPSRAEIELLAAQIAKKCTIAEESEQAL